MPDLVACSLQGLVDLVLCGLAMFGRPCYPRLATSGRCVSSNVCTNLHLLTGPKPASLLSRLCACLHLHALVPSQSNSFIFDKMPLLLHLRLQTNLDDLNLLS